MNRKRSIYFTYIIIVIALGLASRKFGSYLPNFISKYAGDTLWAIMVYLGLGFLFNKASVFKITMFSLIFSYCIEISQLYQDTWINSIRSTTIGALILGHGFLYSDLICYSIGIVLIAIVEYITYKLIGYFKN
ncbi:DUF2809 domain-containing protein [Clostridium carnis]